MRIAIAAALVALAPGAFAQSLDDGDAVVVTATRFPDSKRDLPVGITVITAEDIRQSATSTLPEILAQHGLLHVRDNSGTPNRQVDLRGFGIGVPGLGTARGLGLVAFDLVPGAKSLLARHTMGLAGRVPRLARALDLA